jgi:ParB family chromosome partitioning protein
MAKEKRTGLGTGINQIIPENNLISNLNTNTNKGLPIFVKIVDIEKNPLQPRKYFNKNEITKLADSIKDKGIIEPLVVIRKEQNYQLIAGHRRLMAAKEAKLESVPVIIREKLTDYAENLELALIENIMRQNLNPIEEAESYERMANEFSRQILSIAKLVGKDRSTIDNSIRLLKLPDEVKNEIRLGRLSAGHGKVLLSLESKTDLIIQAKNEILSNSLSVRQTELLVKRLLKDKKVIKDNKNIENEAYYESISRAISDKIGGLKVKVFYTGNNKKIEIKYNSNEDIELFLKKLDIDV